MSGYTQTRLLFDSPAKRQKTPSARKPADPNLESDQQRRERHKWNILDRLRCGRMSNGELGNSVLFGLNPRARISDLRKLGYVIVNTKANDGTGLSWYELVKEP